MLRYSLQILARCEKKSLGAELEEMSLYDHGWNCFRHKISASKIEVDKVKIKVMTWLSTPTNLKDVEIFWDTCFYRNFIKDFKIARPLIIPLHKKSQI